ncbi:MAG: helix-turn-helix domain-containing protein [Rhodobacteraceae bacterium]|nr:helix-turn-helix domain-containing protein [Paracoccaceae bacterium]
MANEIDAHVGKKLRQRRWMLGLTQQQLGDRIGIKFQQVQKYETGQNRIAASRLWELARATEVDIAYFFEGLGEEDSVADMNAVATTAARGDVMSNRETIELVRAYYRTPETQRRPIFDLLRVMGGPNVFEPSGDSEDTIAPNVKVGGRNG